MGPLDPGRNSIQVADINASRALIWIRFRANVQFSIICMHLGKHASIYASIYRYYACIHASIYHYNAGIYASIYASMYASIYAGMFPQMHKCDSKHNN